LLAAHRHIAVEDKCVFVLGDQFFVLAAVLTPNVLQLNAVELRRARSGASVDGELALDGVADLTDAGADNVLVVVRDFPLKEQRHLDSRQVVL